MALRALLVLSVLSQYLSNGLILPPEQKLKMGMGEQLKDECIDLAEDNDFRCIYAEEATKGHHVGKAIFNGMAEAGREQTKIFLPAYVNFGGELERLMGVINTNSDILGGVLACVEHWPEVPASCVELVWPDPPAGSFYEVEDSSVAESHVHDTEQYVDKTLSGLGLCPFTKSMRLSALGLENAGVQPGPVKIRHSALIGNLSKETAPAVAMAALYWGGVSDIIDRPEEEVATFLLVCPSIFNDFKTFFHACDNLIEKSNLLLSPPGVGRVWFHPEYKLADVGYQSGGHAPPLDEVNKLMDGYLTEHPGAEKPDAEGLARAHDKTQWTPHPTINLLRPRQLNIAKEVDIKEKRAKVYPRNVVRILEAEKKGELEGLMDVKN
ncbi:hypothetical protein TrLO_g7010 [Triparma laevis f. longispina]|uniref:Uncharacterized protein n=1 Tax=Triparma laevis f. longispina TaxID=1714387 RepID=A0A9W7API3_9STRA|nr:hypothetical protein TrLO_g7010 [Triparma laevis f. longispina]